MNIDTMTLQSLIAVSEMGSFTKAADRVGRTQSAVSQQIIKLEAMLGKALFVRAKTLILTPEGEIFLGYARQILSLQQEVFSRFKSPELEGEVRFGLPENFASIYLSEILADFVRIHPRILLNTECDLTLNLFNRFKKEEFDLVLVKMNRPEDFPNSVQVWSEPLVWIGDKTVLSVDKPIPLVLGPHPCVYRAAALKTLEAAARSWRLVFSSNSYASTIAAVKAGMGITVAPLTMIPEGVGVLDITILPELPVTHVSLLKHQSDNSAINTLEEFVLRRLRN